MPCTSHLAPLTTALALLLGGASCAASGNQGDSYPGTDPGADATSDLGGNDAPTSTADAALIGEVSFADGSAACTLPGCPCSGVGDGGGVEAVGCWTGPASMRNVGACHDGVQHCIQMGEVSQWGPCGGQQLDCGDASMDAPGCTDGTLTWTYFFDGRPKSFNPTLGAGETLVAVTSITGYACWDQNGNCTACPSWGAISASGKSYSINIGDYDSDNSGSCTYTFRTQTCP
jgi:hypothetical protein